MGRDMTTEAILRLTDNVESLAAEVAKIQKQEQRVLWKLAPYIALALSVGTLIWRMSEQSTMTINTLTEHARLIKESKEIETKLTERMYQIEMRHAGEDYLEKKGKK
jgi:NADH dehydrogenase FAD-containing subunit